MIHLAIERIAYLNLHPSNIVVSDKSKVVLKNFGYSEEFEQAVNIISLPHYNGQLSMFSPP